MKSPIILKHASASATVISPIDSLFENRIIMLDSDIDSDAATQVIAMLSYLSNKSSDPIHLYINSPGGFDFRRVGDCRLYAWHRKSCSHPCFWRCGKHGLDYSCVR